MISNPERLQILVELRNRIRPRLTQKDVAEKFGLIGNQGRKTVGAWERGENREDGEIRV